VPRSAGAGRNALACPARARDVCAARRRLWPGGGAQEGGRRQPRQHLHRHRRDDRRRQVDVGHGARRHLGIDVHYEPVADNEYLADFYRDTARYSFAMQVYLLNRRFQQHQEIIWRGRSAVQDRTIYEDSIFAKMLAATGLMDERDYRTYQQLFRHMSNFMCKPSCIIYLDVSPQSSLERIQMRSRDVEATIKLEYLEALYEGYQEFVQSISKVVPVIRVDYDRFATAEEMADVIRREYLDVSFLRQATRFDPTR
jgi:deoxyadenosine kinase